MRTRTFHTDLYQLTMAFADIVLGRGNIQAGFEAFVRDVKPTVNPNGKSLVADLPSLRRKIEKLKLDVFEEIRTPFFKHTFLALLEGKFSVQEPLFDLFLREFKDLDLEFELTIVNVPEVYPMVPVVQYKGPIWLGRILETQILYLVNSDIGFSTAQSVNNLTPFQTNIVSNQLFHDDHEYFREYRRGLDARAKAYRESTSRVLLEAALRRAPNLFLANIATEVALNNGWNGTSNIAPFIDNSYYQATRKISNTGYLYGTDPESHIGGTMAHSFVMGYRIEGMAFEDWHKVYGANTTYLIDTYDVMGALEFLVEKLKTAPVGCVRIDSEPLEDYAFEVRELLNSSGWTNTQIFLSGDLTPARLKEFERKGVPFDKCMAGTKYVNDNPDLAKMNPGFVYKLVEVEDRYGKFYPVKKSKSKSNYPGLKEIVWGVDGLVVKCGEKASNHGLRLDRIAPGEEEFPSKVTFEGV